MARGVNKVILVGNLGGDPETRSMPSGMTVTNIRIATSESWKDKASGAQQERTEWHSIALFGRLGEIAAEYLRKGSQVFIEGKLRTRKWQDKQGNDRFTTEIIADNMQMLGGRAGGGAAAWAVGASAPRRRHGTITTKRRRRPVEKKTSTTIFRSETADGPRARGSIVLEILTRKQGIREAELRQIANPARIENAVEVIDLVLDDTRVKIAHAAIQRPPLLVAARIPQMRIAGYQAAHARHRQAAFPPLCHLLAERREFRIDEHGVRHGLGLRIAGVRLDAENDHPQTHAYLRRSKARAIELLHRVPHIGQQRLELGRAERHDRIRYGQEPRIAHFEYVAYCHGS